eukprot:808439_1
MEVGVVYTGGEVDYNDNEDIFTPDGMIKNQIIPIDNNGEQYLSAAQKHKLYSTPKNEQNIYDKYLSPAQKEHMRKQDNITPGGSDSDIDNENNALVSDDNQTSDDEIIADMKTAGYIGMENINGNKQIHVIHDEHSDSLSEMSPEISIEKKLTIGAE